MPDLLTPLRSLGLVCSLKPSPAPSSSALIAEHVFETLRDEGVECEAVRVPKAVASATAAAARNAAHLARVLKSAYYPAYE